MFRRAGLFCSVALGIAAFAVETEAATVQCYTNTGNPKLISYTANSAVQSTAVCNSGNLNESGDITFDGMQFKLGINDNGVSTDGTTSWVTDPFNNQGGAGLLPWSISLASDWMGIVLLELKQSRTYSLFDVTASCNFDSNTCSGTWSTSGPGNSVNGLSHTRAWYKTTSTVVPLPAALPLLVGGLGVLGFAGYRRRKSS